MEQSPAWGWREVFYTLGLTVGGTAALLIGARALALFAGLDTTGGFSSPLVFIVGLGSTLLLIASVYLFAARRAGWAALGLRPAPWQALLATPVLVLLGLFGVALANLAVAAIQGGNFENPQVEAISGGRAFNESVFISLFLLIAVLVPIAEELLFRGMIYPLLRLRLGPVAAIIVNAALFAAIHLLPQLMPALFVIGLLIAFLREWSGSLIPCILYHALQNALGLVVISTALTT